MVAVSGLFRYRRSVLVLVRCPPGDALEVCWGSLGGSFGGFHGGIPRGIPIGPPKVVG